MQKPQKTSQILKGLQVAITGRIGRTKQDLIHFLEHHSGIFNPSVSQETSIFICSENTFYKGNSQLSKAQELKIPVVEENYLDDCISHQKLLETDKYLLGREKQPPPGAEITSTSNKSSTSNESKENSNLNTNSTQSSTNNNVIGSTGPILGGASASTTAKLVKRNVKNVTTKIMPTTVKALLNADPNVSIGVALAQSYFTPEGLSNDAVIDVTRFNIQYVNNLDEIQTIRDLPRGFVAFDPICTDEGLAEEFEELEIENSSQDQINENYNQQMKDKPRKLYPGSNFTIISKKYIEKDCEIKNKNKYHIYEENEGKLLYNITLNQTDLKCNSNSYYKMQLLVPDSSSGKTFYVYFAWGRVGTSIGSFKLADFNSLSRALKEFSDKFYQKTRNRWNDFISDRFVKYGGAYYPIEMIYEDDDDDHDKQSNIENIEIQPSKLSPEVQHLMQLIFDTSTMQKAMLNMKLDMDKMPLGKLSKNTIQIGFSTLSGKK